VIIPPEIQRRYAEQERLVGEIGRRVASTLQPYCNSNGFVFDGRAKTLDSLAEKIETGRFRSWEELDDLYACTIAVPLPAEEEDVLNFLADTFEQVDLKKRLTARKPPDVFRFDSTRFISRLKKPPGMTTKDSIFDVRFEVQIKTLFELAWSRTTHAFAYKSSRIDWRALRLVAALKASVEQMDLLLSDFENAMKLLGEARWYDVEKKKKIQDTFLACEPAIPKEVWPKDLSRLAENCYSLIELLQRQARWDRKDRDVDIYDESLGLLEEAIKKENIETFPRSISLFQLVFAVLTQRFHLPKDLRAWFPISSEMETLFPHTREISPRFAF
jgi:ppGpp synthetase/RelA/SpoT-type nucleotidyltranferase